MVHRLMQVVGRDVMFRLIIMWLFQDEQDLHVVYIN
jgi:hypothetical protein